MKLRERLARAAKSGWVNQSLLREDSAQIEFPERRFEIGQRVLYLGRFRGTVTGYNYVSPSIAQAEGMSPCWEYWIAIDPCQEGFSQVSSSLEVIVKQSDIFVFALNPKARRSKKSFALAL